MAASLDIENKMLLACARVTLNEKHHSLMSELLQRTINWDALSQLAAHHKLLPLLYRHLSTHWPDQVPTKQLTRLQQFYDYNKLLNLQKLTALVQIDQCFKQNGITSLTFKGPLLTLSHFKDIGLRTFCDIDILVRSKDLEKAAHLLKEKGYTYLPEGIPEQYFFKFARTRYHGQLIDKNGMVVELHWEISGHYGAKRLDYTLLEPFMETFEIQGYKIANLTPEMLLVYLAIHAQRHLWQKYDYLLCIAELLNTIKDIDWDTVSHIGKTLQIEKVVFLAVFMASEILSAYFDKTCLKNSAQYHSLAKLTKRHEENWQAINTTVIKRNSRGYCEWRRVYPIALQFTGRTKVISGSIIRDYYCQNRLIG